MRKAEHWYTKKREEREGKQGWLFEIHPLEGEPYDQFLYDEGLALKFTLGGYEYGENLAAIWSKADWFEYNPSNFQCYIFTERNLLLQQEGA